MAKDIRDVGPGEQDRNAESASGRSCAPSPGIPCRPCLEEAELRDRRFISHFGLLFCHLSESSPFCECVDYVIFELCDCLEKYRKRLNVNSKGLRIQLSYPYRLLKLCPDGCKILNRTLKGHFCGSKL